MGLDDRAPKPKRKLAYTVRRFLLERSDGRHVTSMTIEDAEHFSPEERARIIARYPAHERDARTKGVPQLGSGRIFPVIEETTSVLFSNRAISPPYTT